MAITIDTKKLCNCGYPAKWVIEWPERPYYIGYYCDAHVAESGLKEDEENRVMRLWLWARREKAKLEEELSVKPRH